MKTQKFISQERFDRIRELISTVSNSLSAVDINQKHLTELDEILNDIYKD